MVFPAWSFAVAGADFANAGVTVTSGGANVAVTVSQPPNGYGENTLAFTVAGCNPCSRPAADTAYRVTINNVSVGGTLRSYSYTVTLIDPAK